MERLERERTIKTGLKGFSVSFALLWWTIGFYFWFPHGPDYVPPEPEAPAANPNILLYDLPADAANGVKLDVWRRRKILVGQEVRFHFPGFCFDYKTTDERNMWYLTEGTTTWLPYQRSMKGQEQIVTLGIRPVQDITFEYKARKAPC